MLALCMMTMVGSFYLQFYGPSYVQDPTVIFSGNYPSNWTLDENKSTGAYRICSAKYPDWCLGIGEGRHIQDLEMVTLQKANSPTTIYWNYNKTTGFLQPHGYNRIYLITMDMSRDYKPLQLWDGYPNFNHSQFVFKKC